jgi:hypothetical protein
MKTDIWVLIIILVIIVILSVTIAIFSIQNENTKSTFNSSIYTNKYLSPYRWSKPIPSADSARNTCKLYQFPGTMVDNVAYPGNPTLNTDVLDSMTPISFLPPCIDVDRIIAKQVVHTCVGLTGGTGTTGSAVVCYRNDGTVAAPGESEIFYESTGCNVTVCGGSLSLISLDYSPAYCSTTGMSGICQGILDPPVLHCIQGENPGSDVSMHICDINSEKQLFRVTRKDPGNVPVTGINSGILAQFFDRDTGQCLVSSLGASGVTSTVQLGDCVANQGYNWMLIPSFNTSSPGPVIGCTSTGLQTVCTPGSTGQIIGTVTCQNANNYTSCTGSLTSPDGSITYCSIKNKLLVCNGSPGMTYTVGEIACLNGHLPDNSFAINCEVVGTTTPPQIIYYGGTGVPVFNTNQQMLQFVENLGSMIPATGDITNVLLTTYATDIKTKPAKSAQYIDYTLYNKINSLGPQVPFSFPLPY